ncbi:hypothetical protein NKH93_33995 [Mesorhizobium sp. M0954]|uniref:hypothetical protein n=1 Tax=Mesorhizobium sp. M0954 TaxID=2957032 RepID=UPI003335B880
MRRLSLVGKYGRVILVWISFVCIFHQEAKHGIYISNKLNIHMDFYEGWQLVSEERLAMKTPRARNGKTLLFNSGCPKSQNRTPIHGEPSELSPQDAFSCRPIEPTLS